MATSVRNFVLPAPKKQNKKRDYDLLDRPIKNVCETNEHEGLPPMHYFREQKPKTSWFDEGLALLQWTPPDARSDPPPVTWNMIERLLSALRSLAKNGNDKNEVASSITIREFRNYSVAEQLKFINRLWDAAAVPRNFSTAGRHMYDPEFGDIEVLSQGPMPSSIRPAVKGESDFIDGGVYRSFADLKVGFRVDGSDDGAIARIKENGMTQQRLNADLMNRIRGLRIDGTDMTDTTKVRIWTGNDDTFNETGVCVSRSLLGACAFPERNKKGNVYLWAVSCGDLLGCDVERYQLNLPGNRNWRPGEKAFQYIPKEKVLAYVRIHRDGSPGGAGEGWVFTVPAGSTWTYPAGRDSVPEKQRTFIEDELAAFTDGKNDCQYSVKGWYDFAKK